MVLGIGLALAGGFLVGPMMSFAGMVSSGGGSNQDDGPTIELPSTNYKEDSFSYGYREQGYLAYQNNVVFVTGVYSTAEEREDLRSLQDLTNRFKDKVYVQLVNESEASPIVQDFGVVDFPKVIVVGGQPVQRGGSQGFYSDSLTEYSDSTLDSSVCSGFRQLENDLAALCV